VIRAFIDSSVLFAASYSQTGSSRRLLLEAIRGRVVLVIDQHILEETERNLAEKAPQALAAYHTLIELLAVEVVEKPDGQEVGEAASYVHAKDAPVVAAALKAKVDYLVTWDRRHFIDDPQVAERSGLTIATPDVLVRLIVNEYENQL
jgi:predicted nucleic acid-binding protein